MEYIARDRARPPIEKLYRMAKRYSRRQEEVADLVQDLLLEAVTAGKDFSDGSFMRWSRGFLRNRAAFLARTEGRRRKREELAHYDEQEPSNIDIQLPEGFIVCLRPSLRIIAQLVNCGLNRKEILYLLNIADTALRQRLTALRREWKSYLGILGRLPEYPDRPIPTLPGGLIRRSLKQAFRHTTHRKENKSNRVIGSHDPDGHLFTIRFIAAHKTDPGGNNSIDNEG